MSKIRYSIIAILLWMGALLGATLKGQNHLIEGIESYNLLIKFKAEARVTVEEKQVRFNGVRSPQEAQLLSLLAGHSISSVFQFTEQERTQIRLGITRTDRGRFDKYSFSGLVSLDGAAAMGKEEVLKLAQELERFDIVEYCAIESATPVIPPSTQQLRATPDFTWRQWYREYDHGGDTIGINIEAAWELGIKGQGVSIADVEWGMDYLHEDLQSPKFIEGLKTTNNNYDDHGTAVAGILIAKDNGFGVTGMVHEYENFYGFSEITKGRPAAIAMAIDSLEAGDVIIYEMQTGGQGGEFVPADYNQAVWDITKKATDAGIIICAAAGNGNQNLDGSFYSAYMNRGDNGSIIVGAGTIKGRNKASFSTYGSRVDVQGWGDWCVTTTGYTTLYNGGPHANYTKNFSGTSSATPVVTSAVVAIQSYAKNVLGKTLTPREMRTLLKETGTAQGSGGHIGPLPNVGAAIEKLGGTIEDTYTLTVTTGSGSGKYKEGAEISISAETSQEGVFKKWSGDTEYLADSTKSTTTVTMPAKDISLFAVFEVDTLTSENLLSYGGWEGIKDALGSAAVVKIDSLGDSVTAVSVDLTKVAQPNDTTYPYANLTGYFENPFSEVTTMEIRYSATADMKMLLPMNGETDTDGSAHYIVLPKSSVTTIKQVKPSVFEQPSWQDKKTSLDLSKVHSVSFELAAEGSEESSGSLKISSYKMVDYIPTAVSGVTVTKNSMDFAVHNAKSFTFHAPQRGEYRIELFTLAGRKLEDYSMQFPKGATAITRDGATLGSGMIVVTISGAGHSLSKRLLVQ